MKVEKEQVAQFVNENLASESMDWICPSMKLLCGYELTYMPRSKLFDMCKGKYCYGVFDLSSYRDVDHMIDEIWRCLHDRIEYDKESKPYLKAGSVELTRSECEKIAQSGKMIVAYRDVYQLYWSNAQGRYMAMKAYHSMNEFPLTKRGRFVCLTPSDVNHLLGFELFIKTPTSVEVRVLEKLNATV
jgi:hypothetical protein